MGNASRSKSNIPPGEAQLKVLLECPGNLLPLQHLQLDCRHALHLVSLWHALADTLEQQAHFNAKGTLQCRNPTALSGRIVTPMMVVRGPQPCTLARLWELSNL